MQGLVELKTVGCKWIEFNMIAVVIIAKPERNLCVHRLAELPPLREFRGAATTGRPKDSLKNITLPCAVLSYEARQMSVKIDDYINTGSE